MFPWINKENTDITNEDVLSWYAYIEIMYGKMEYLKKTASFIYVARTPV